MSQKQMEAAATLGMDELGSLMTSIRRRLNAARLARDGGEIDVAQALYNRCALLLQNWVARGIRAIDDSAEVRSLRDALKDIAARLKAEKKAIESLERALDTATEIVKALEGLLIRVLA